jgi:hypothetical protein
MVAVNASSVTTVAGVGTLLRALAVGSLPVAVATILQRFGLDHVSGTPCDVERLQTTIGNALPGSTFLGLATLVSLEHLRHASASWWAPTPAVVASLEAVADASADEGAALASVRTDPIGGRCRSRRAGAEARSVAPVAAAETAGTSSEADASAWIGPAAIVVGACAAVFAALAVTRRDFGRTWVAIPVALMWGAAVARATSRGVRVPPAVAVAGWLFLILALAIANGLTLSGGPQAGFVVGAGLWVVGVATACAGRLDVRVGGWASGAVIVAGLAIGADWFVPAVGCRTCYGGSNHFG